MTIENPIPNAGSKTKHFAMCRCTEAWCGTLDCLSDQPKSFRYEFTFKRFPKKSYIIQYAHRLFHEPNQKVR